MEQQTIIDAIDRGGREEATDPRELAELLCADDPAQVEVVTEQAAEIIRQWNYFDEE